MIEELRRYPMMKDSGVPWLGEAPVHWEVRKLRHLLRRRTERNRPDLPLLSVVRERGVILRNVTDTGGNHNYIPDDLTNYKVVREGQFAMNKMKAWQGSYGVSRHDGIVSPAYFVFDLSGLAGGFFHAAVRSQAYVPAFTRASDGVRVGQWDLAETRMREIHFLIPPRTEQTAIIRFLDYVDRRTRRYIRAKQRLIKLLQEQKQTIIRQAVTRGLDPNVSLKPSGVQWLGDVPEHWAVKRLSALAEFKAGKAHEQFVDPAGDYICVNARFVSTGGAARKHCIECLVPAKRGDVLMVMSDLPNGRALARAFLVDDDARYAVNQRVCAITAISAHSRYLFFYLNRNPGLLRHDDGSNQTHLSNGDFKTLPVLVPPRDEQIAISAYLARQTATRDCGVETARRQIELLREFHQRLVADVTTGKVDVREAAARLPDERHEPELPSDAATGEDAEEAVVDDLEVEA